MNHVDFLSGAPMSIITLDQMNHFKIVNSLHQMHTSMPQTTTALYSKFYELSKSKERKENGNIFYEMTFKMGRRNADQPVTISNTSQQTSRALCRTKYWTWLIQNQHFTPLTHWLLWPEISFIVFIRLVFIVRYILLSPSHKIPFFIVQLLN